MKNFWGEELRSSYSVEVLIQQLHHAKNQSFEYLVFPSKRDFRVKGMNASEFLTKEDYLKYRRKEWEEYDRIYEDRNFERWLERFPSALYLSIDDVISQCLKELE